MDEKTAWDIIHKFCNELRLLNDKSLTAIFVVGSLAGGYYRPWNSDIDVTLIIKDGLEQILNNSTVKSIIKELLRNYPYPIGFEAFIKYENQLFPPYLPKKQMTIEILRLRYQSQLVFGNFAIDSITLPTKTDILNDALYYEKKLNSNYRDPIAVLDETGLISLEFKYMRLYLILHNDIIEFNKVKIIELFDNLYEHTFDKKSFLILREFLNGIKTDEYSLEILRSFCYSLRSIINEDIKIWMK